LPSPPNSPSLPALIIRRRRRGRSPERQRARRPRLGKSAPSPRARLDEGSPGLAPGLFSFAGRAALPNDSFDTLVPEAATRSPNAHEAARQPA
jgi:hypothetical protein